jgi:hypothetical protein
MRPFGGMLQHPLDDKISDSQTVPKGLQTKSWAQPPAALGRDTMHPSALEAANDME